MPYPEPGIMTSRAAPHLPGTVALARGVLRTPIVSKVNSAVVVVLTLTTFLSPGGETLVSGAQDGAVIVGEPAQKEKLPVAEQVAARRNYKDQLSYDLRKEIDALSELALFGPDAESVLNTDARGLRITLPDGRADCRNVGVELSMRIRGDFDIELGFELLSIGDHIADPAAGLQMRLAFAAPSTPIVALARFRNRYSPQHAPLFGVVGHDGETFASYNITILPDGKEKPNGVDVRAREPRGRLRLVRSGPELQSLVSDGESPYRSIKSEQIGTADVETVRFFGFSGWAPVAVDVRFTDLQISADEFPDGTPGRFAWPRALLAAVMVAGLVVSLAIGAWIHVRRAARTQSSA